MTYKFKVGVTPPESRVGHRGVWQELCVAPIGASAEVSNSQYCYISKLYKKHKADVKGWKIIGSRRPEYISRSENVRVWKVQIDD